MDLAGDVAAALSAAGEAFGPAPAAPPQPRWGALYAELDTAADPEFAVAIELIYEGYLLHYRESRAVSLQADDLATRLLAGDYFYARGLRSIAARGDADAVGLLARLMAACSYLRSLQAPFTDDDALWAYTTAGLAAQHGGTTPALAAALFDEVDAGFAGPEPVDVPATVARAAGRLDLPDAASLSGELERAALRSSAAFAPAAFAPEGHAIAPAPTGTGR